MDDGLEGIRAALAAIPHALLVRLLGAADESPHLAPGLLAFISHACDWELGRRRNQRFRLNGPHAAIPPEEMSASFATLAVLMATFGEQSPIASLLAAIGDPLGADPPAVHWRAPPAIQFGRDRSLTVLQSFRNVTCILDSRLWLNSDRQQGGGN